MPPINKIIDTFRKNGFKITPQRRLLFNILSSARNHPHAEEVYQEAITKMPDISRTTVYSTLNELVEMGFIEPVNGVLEKHARFDPMTIPHHHLYCQKCGKIVDVDLDISALIPPADVTDGFEIIKKQITFFGYCQHCKQKA